jgi:uroporphyrinogen decarboxylase
MSAFTTRRPPDYRQFVRALTRREKPAHLPFYEHLASPGFIARRTGTAFDRMPPAHPDYWRIYVDFWVGMGYDVVPMEIPPTLPLKAHEDRTGQVSRGSEANVTIQSMADFEAYPWPETASPLEFHHFDRVAELLPDGVKIVGGVCAGPFEWVSTMMGVEGLSLALFMDPDLVEAMFRKIGELHLSGLRQIARLDAVCALRQGDDLGFKTSTFMSPQHLRQYVFPIYRRMADAAHAQGKPFILHSCGNLGEVYDDLIDDCGIDAKHSFEDVILPVTEFKKQYGRRVTPLGGLDVDRICRSTEPELRAYAREIIDACFADGFWALGTGNSLTDYMPVENYLVVLDEGLKTTG